MKNLPRVFRYLRPYSHLALVVLGLMVLAAMVDLLVPWPLQVLIDNVLGDQPLPDTLKELLGPFASRERLLILAVVAGFGVVLLSNAVSVLNDFIQTKLEQQMVLDLRSDLFEHSQRLSLAFHDRRRSGMLIYAINSQGDSVAGLIMTIPALGQSLFTLIGMFWIVLTIDVQLALLSLLVLPFLMYSVRYYATTIQERLTRVKGMEAESLSIIHEAISMLRVIVAFGRERYEHGRFRQQGQKAIRARIGITVRQTLFSLFVNLTTAFGTALVLGFGAYKVLEGDLTVGKLLVIMSYIAAVYKPLETITYTCGTIQEKFVSQRFAFNLLDTKPEVKEASNPVVVERVQGALAFENVDFHYKGRVDTLRNVSFEVEPGQTVAVIGPTGAGKTTLISLIPRFYDPQRGRVLLDGVDIKNLSLASLREQISLVLQEPLLFSGTIRDNIRYGRLEATDEEIMEAARCANAHDFIMRLPKQYETELGERGSQLSGGERQRICVARAFLKDAPILILDEPTSSIDSKTEAVILEALDRLMVGRTSFMIAHRLSTIHRADFILTMEQGRVVQQGTHEDLLCQEGLYKQLWELQNRHGKRTAQPVV